MKYGSNFWTDEEMILLNELHSKHKDDIPKICNSIPNRTPGSIRQKLITSGLIPSENEPFHEIHPSFVKGFRRGSLGLKKGKREQRGPRREIEFTITDEDVLRVYKNQEGKCYLSGVDITIPHRNFEIKTCVFTASIDRIDSSKGYTLDNIALCHKRVNIMKGKMENEEFISWAKEIAENNK